MKKKIKKEYVVICILCLLLICIIFFYIKKTNVEEVATESISTNSDSNTTISEVEVTKQTIINTLASSGQISSAVSEKLELHATYYFEEIYFEENNYVAEGENILMYSNGTYMVAPYDLIIVSINIPKSGEKCLNSNYIEVSSIQTLTMSVNIDEKNLSSVSVGQEAEITLSALEDKKYTGFITNISETGTYTSNGSTFNAIITLENDGNIKIGMSASCNIILEKAENVVSVPIEAIKTSNDVKYVVVVQENGTTENITVETGISNNAYTEIKSGLSGGEKIQITESTSSTTSSNRFNKGGMMTMDQSTFGGSNNPAQAGRGMQMDASTNK